MKIVHVNFSFTVGGIETMLVDIMKKQADGNDVYLFVINDEYARELLDTIDARVKVILIKRRRGARGVVGFLKLLKMNILIRFIRPDVVHCHRYDVGPTIIGLKSRKILTLHDVGCDLRLCDRYESVYAISEAVRVDSVARGFQRLSVIVNGIDVDAVQKEKRPPDGQFRIIQVSRLVHEKKGQDILINALGYIVHHMGIRNISIDFIGTGPSRVYLDREVRRLGLDGNISFLGARDREYIYNNLCKYDLLVQPSRFEGFGLTVAEGMAAGIPVLVSNIQGPMEVIDNGKYGFVFDDGCHQDLAKMIVMVMEQLGVAEIVDAASLRVKQCYDIEGTVEGYKRAYGYIAGSCLI